MHKIFLLVYFAAFAMTGTAQKKTGGYAYLQPAAYFNKKFDNRILLSAGVGLTPSQHFGIGTAFDFFIFGDNEKFVVAKLDFRPFFVGLDKPIAYFVSVQPGYVLYDKATGAVGTKGNFAMDALIGLMGRPKKKKTPGITMSAGYSLLSFSSSNIITRYNGIKVQAGIAF